MTTLAPFPIDAPVVATLERLWDADHAAVVVGGAVRDSLLGAPSADWDVATDASPEHILELFPGSSYHNRFGTVGVGDVEVTTFRRDHRYADHRRPDSVTFTDDIEVDLRRRDLTINAIAWGRGRAADAAAGFVDPCGGRADLDARLIRAVGDANERFDEDALRLLRAVRLAAHLDFTIEPGTLAALHAHAGDVGWVASERVGSELRRMLLGPRPSLALELLRTTGLATTVLPELAGSPDAAHAGDLLEAMRAAAGDPTAAVPAVAAALHGRRVGSAEAAARRLGLRAADAARIERLGASIHESGTEPIEGPALRRFMRAQGDELDDLLDLRDAHAAAIDDRAAAERAVTLRTAVTAERAAGTPLRIGDLAVDGEDLRIELGLAEGPRIGRILAALLEAVIDDPTLAERSRSLAHARALDRALDGASGPDAEGRVGSRA